MTSTIYEIEMKALLTEAEHARLKRELPQRFETINEEITHTTRYRPGDVRLRYSDKRNELVIKDGDAATLSRKETFHEFASREELESYRQQLLTDGFKADPPWVKHKQEYRVQRQGEEFVLCLQHIVNFAYILEVEILKPTDEGARYHDTLDSILRELGCEPIEPQDFKARIEQYIKNNKQ